MLAITIELEWLVGRYFEVAEKPFFGNSIHAKTEKPDGCSKFEIRISKAEIHPPETGKNSNDQNTKDQEWRTLLGSGLLWILKIVVLRLFRISCSEFPYLREVG
jgi:hypothetical protein